VGGPDGTDRVDNLQKQAGTVVEAAAVGVGALVGEGRKEFVEQVAVGSVDFNDIETSDGCAPRSLCEGAGDVVDARLIEGPGLGVVGREGDGTWRYWLPSTLSGRNGLFRTRKGRCHGGFASSVGKLDSGVDTLGVHEFDNPRESWQVLVFIDSKIAGGDATLGHDRGGLNQNEAGTTLGAGAEMNQVPVVGEAVVCGVLAHG
jgi:hypothetical protein